MDWRAQLHAYARTGAGSGQTYSMSASLAVLILAQVCCLLTAVAGKLRTRERLKLQALRFKLSIET